MVNTMLTEKEAIAKMEEIGFAKSSAEDWNKDNRGQDFVGQIQTAACDHNINNISNTISATKKKFYIVQLSKGIEIRAWALR